MSDKTGIQWTDHTFNCWWGCTKVSPGCTNCYAESWDARWKGGHWGKDAPRRFFGDAHWNEPLKWNRAAEMEGRRHRVFCASMADVFEDRPDLEAERDHLWDLIHRTPHLDWQLLTKRPENMERMLPWGRYGAGPSPWRNVWLGTTVEDQKRADERIPLLLATPATVRFLSCEPLLGPVTLQPVVEKWARDALEAMKAGEPLPPSIKWVIVGGESGTDARPFDVEWARSLARQCAEAGIPCFVKQLGSAAHLRQSHGADPAEWPADLRVRQFPERGT